MTYTLPGIAPLRNVAALVTLMRRLADQSPLLPKMGCFYGPAGDGKTSAAAYARNQFDALLIECRSTWNRSDVCKTVLRELGLKPKGTINQMCEALAEQLLLDDRPLIVDEADLIVKKGQGEIFRDIYEMSKVPVILIGEERFPQMLQAAGERMHGRIADWVSTEAAELADVTHLASLYAPGVKISPDLTERLLVESKHSVRRICINLENIRALAQLLGLTEIDPDVWGEKTFYTGQAPAPRADASARGRAV